MPAESYHNLAKSYNPGFIGRFRSGGTGFTGRRSVAGALSTRQASSAQASWQGARRRGHTHRQTSPADAAGAAAQREAEKQLEKTGRLARASVLTRA